MRHLIDDLRYLWCAIPEGKAIAIAVGIMAIAVIMVIVEKIAQLSFSPY